MSYQEKINLPDIGEVIIYKKIIPEFKYSDTITVYQIELNDQVIAEFDLQYGKIRNIYHGDERVILPILLNLLMKNVSE